MFTQKRVSPRKFKPDWDEWHDAWHTRWREIDSAVARTDTINNCWRACYGKYTPTVGHWTQRYGDRFNFPGVLQSDLEYTCEEYYDLGYDPETGTT